MNTRAGGGDTGRPPGTRHPMGVQFATVVLQMADRKTTTWESIWGVGDEARTSQERRRPVVLGGLIPGDPHLGRLRDVPSGPLASLSPILRWTGADPNGCSDAGRSHGRDRTS